MARLPCHACGAAVDGSAWRCPSCGGWTFRPPPQWLQFVGALLLIGGVAFGLYAGAWNIAIFGALPLAILWLAAKLRRDSPK